MFEISRRDPVLGSAGAALVFGLKGPVSFIGAAQAQRAADSLKYKVGDIEVFSLHDGGIEVPLAEGFVKNAALDDVKKALTAAGIGPDKFNNPFTATAIRTGGKIILFDTGFGGNGPATVGKLADNMKAAGLDPAAVSTVVITHFHPDHISGLWVKETNAQVFPNAEIMMGEVEYKFWTDPALVEKLPEAARGNVKRIQATFPTWKNVKQYNNGAELVPVERFHIPGVFLGGTIRPESVTTLASQVDLLPTALSLIGVVAVHPALGRDLTDPAQRARPGRAFLQYDQTHLYLTDRAAVAHRPDLPPAFFHVVDGRLGERLEPDPGLERLALASAMWPQMCYAQGDYRLP